MKNFIFWSFISSITIICISTGYYYTIFIRDNVVPPEKSQPTTDPLLELNKQIINLEIKKNFWKNRIELANQDQYNIFIDLSDSLISLDISGITAHTAEISYFEYSEIYESHYQKEEIIRLLRDPFHLIDEWSSIPKNPIRVKDISGFQWEPDSLNFVPTQTDTQYVIIALKCSRDLSVMITQQEKIEVTPSYITSGQSEKFNSILKRKNFVEEVPFAQLLQKNWIGIEIPRSDAIALFRAFADNSLLVLCL
jgi:hypothetical protein